MELNSQFSSPFLLLLPLSQPYNSLLLVILWSDLDQMELQDHELKDMCKEKEKGKGKDYILKKGGRINFSILSIAIKGGCIQKKVMLKKERA